MAGRLEVDRVPETHGTVECVEGDRPVTRRCGDAARAARERDAPHVTGTSRSLKADVESGDRFSGPLLL